MMFASVAIAALLAAAQPAAEAAPASQPAAEAKAKAKPKMRRVCYENKGTGSRLERKTCVMEKIDEEDASVEKTKKPDA